MLGPNTDQTPLDRGELTFHAARLARPDVTLTGLLTDEHRLAAVLVIQHQPNHEVAGDARKIDLTDLGEPVGHGIFDLDDTPAPLDITHPRA